MKIGFMSNMNLIKIDHYLYIYYYINKHVYQMNDQFFFLIKVTVKALFIHKHLIEILY